MAEGGEESVEAMMMQVEMLLVVVMQVLMLTVLWMQVQLLELQAQRMESLVAQRRQERAEMEAENARIERQVRGTCVVLSAAVLCWPGALHEGDGARERGGGG